MTYMEGVAHDIHQQLLILVPLLYNSTHSPTVLLGSSLIV